MEYIFIGQFMNKTKICISIFTFAVSAVYSQKSFEITLKEYLQRVRDHYQAIKIANKDVGIALAAFHELRDTENSPYLFADYTYSKTTNREDATFSPVRNNSTEGHDVSVSYNQRFLQTGTGINLSYRINSQDINTISLGNQFEYSNCQHTIALGINQSLLRNGPIGWAGGKRLEMSRTSVKLARSTFNSQLQQYLFTALQQYFSHELTKKSIELSTRTVYDSERILRKNRQKARLGSTDITSVYDSEILLIQNKQELRRQENTLSEIRENLLNLMGELVIDKGVSFKFLTKLESQITPIDKEAVYSNAFRRRKDIEQLKLQKKIKKLGLDIAKISQLPLLDLNLQLSYSRSTTNQNNVYNNLFIGEPDINLGLRFEMPLDPTAFKTITERAKVEYQQASENLENLNKNITLELNNFFRQINYLGKRVKENRLAFDIQIKNVKTYKKNFDNGKIDLQSYITSINQLRNRQTLYLQSIFDYESTKAQLEIAQGKFLADYDIKELKVNRKVK